MVYPDPLRLPIPAIQYGLDGQDLITVVFIKVDHVHTVHIGFPRVVNPLLLYIFSYIL